MMTRPQEMIDAAKAMNEYQVARLKADETLSREAMATVAFAMGGFALYWETVKEIIATAPGDQREQLAMARHVTVFLRENLERIEAELARTAD
jgi:hypothetical protein